MSWCSGLVLSGATFTEGSGGGTVSETVTVRLNRLSDAAVTVTYAVTGKTATAGTDFTSGATTVVIAAGALTGAVTVGVVADADAEGPETLEVVASGAVSAGAPATVVRATGVATILDDDSQQINVAGLTVVGEGSGAGTTTATVTVRLAQPATVPVTVDYATAGAPGVAGVSGSAVAGVDFFAASGTVSFAVGATSATFTVTVVRDAVSERDEDFAVQLSNPVAVGGIALGVAQGLVRIADDDVVTVAVAAATVAENVAGGVAAAVVVTLTGTSDRAVSVSYATLRGTAVAATTVLWQVRNFE